MKVKPLTNRMKQQLALCYQFSKEGIPATTQDFTGTMAAFMKRGFVNIDKRLNRGRIVMIVSLTDAALKYCETYLA